MIVLWRPFSLAAWSWGKRQWGKELYMEEGGKEGSWEWGGCN
jgi:hypothetical protein